MYTLFISVSSLVLVLNWVRLHLTDFQLRSRDQLTSGSIQVT